MLNVPETARIYFPHKLQPVVGTVQFIHGMGEHQGRYEEFAKYLATNGYAVITSDLKGHGTNVKREADLGYIGDTGAQGLVGDIHDLTKVITERYPNVPYIMIGHGMGALVAMAYFKKYDYFLDGLILSGMPSESGRISDRINIRITSSAKGEYYRSKSLYNSIYGTYTGSYAKEGSPSAWLSSAPAVWQEFDSDPKCGFIYTINGYKTYLDLLDNAYKTGSWILKNMHLPIHIVAGSRDNVCGNKHKQSRIAAVFREHGYDNIDTCLIHGMRHDIYNETDSDKTYDYILNRLDEIVKSHEN